MNTQADILHILSEKTWWIGVDLDGTLAETINPHWDASTNIGKPILPMVSRVKTWIAEDKIVKIFTARVSFFNHPLFVERQRTAIKEWCLIHIGSFLEVTCVKDYACIELWDDKCVQVIKNTGRQVVDDRG